MAAPRHRQWFALAGRHDDGRGPEVGDGPEAPGAPAGRACGRRSATIILVAWVSWGIVGRPLLMHCWATQRVGAVFSEMPLPRQVLPVASGVIVAVGANLVTICHGHRLANAQ